MSNSTPYNVRINAETYPALVELAKQSGRSTSNYINKVLKDWTTLASQADKLQGPEAGEILTNYLRGK